MSTQVSDTRGEVEALQIMLIRQMPTWKRVAIVESLTEMVKLMAISGIRQRHPDATTEQIHRLLAEAMLGAELARRVYDHERRDCAGDAARHTGV
ncbi:MAG: hypothetical protein RMM31_10495 [Anaerolineae bacterium]|nr:hypothetical protein [Thermoflexales bacterium]MDW8396657.1 hypothetical protein [Anaerolineae bacterium]